MFSFRERHDVLDTTYRSHLLERNFFLDQILDLILDFYASSMETGAPSCNYNMGQRLEIFCISSTMLT